ncbi:IS1 transposase [Holospora undulata]|uniref:IS1 transposase n=1 Tax=Holospora undulata TaxID=1169117 RepID=UPI00032E55D7|nr:IS1 transposase [Holospora undulata]
MDIWIFKAWISKVYDRAGKWLIDFEFGDHLSQTFKRLFKRLKKWKILFYFVDHWEGFNKIIPSNRLF